MVTMPATMSAHASRVSHGDNCGVGKTLTIFAKPSSDFVLELIPENTS